MYEYEVGRGVPAAVATTAGTEIRLFGAGEECPPGGPRGRWRDRISRGHVCAAALTEGRVVASCWLTRGSVWVEELACELTLRQNEAYLYDASTEVPHRGRGLFSSLLAFLVGYAAAERADRVLIFTLDENAASIRAIERIGFRLARRVVRVEILGRSVVIPWLPVRGGRVILRRANR